MCAIAASLPTAADVVLEHKANGGLVTFKLDGCMATEQRRYADFGEAKASNYAGGHAIDLRDVSVWLRRSSGSTSANFKVTNRCESWRVSEQCIDLEEALVIEAGQEIRLGCDEMYVSCVRTDHPQGNFTLHDGLSVLWWKEELGPDNVMLQQRVLKSLYQRIESCKAESNIQEAAHRSDAEGAALRAKDRIREELQDLDAEFRNVSVSGPIFAPAVCGELKPSAKESYARFLVVGLLGTRLETNYEDELFSTSYWNKYCNEGKDR